MDQEERDHHVAEVTREVVWAAQPGPQTALIECPVMDILFGGARGGGKTDALLGDWLEHQRTEGEHARGVFFREEEKELEEAQARAEAIFLRVGAYYAVTTDTWHFPQGATLKMRILASVRDAKKYQGHQYCVAVGTPVLMADGSWRRIESIRVGDMVMTMEGPKRVDDRVSPYSAPCVEVSDGEQFQVQPVWHPILGASGWQSYASLRGSDSTASAGLSPASGQPRPVTFAATRLRLQDLMDRRGATTESRALGTSHAASSATCEASSRPRSSSPRDPLPVGARAQRASGPIASPSHDDGASCAPTDQTGSQGSPVGCLASSRSGDEQPRRSAVSAQAVAPSPGDAEAPCREDWHADDLGSIPEHSRRDAPTYVHPYTGEPRPLLCRTSDVALTMTPVGERMVCDLTIQDANHYITHLGIANKNTWIGFDEAGNAKNSQPIDMLRACLRSAKGRVRGLILTANPLGLGHKWLKARYVTPSKPMTPFHCEKDHTWRVYIPSRLEDNVILTKNDPAYRDRIIAAGSSTPGLVKAWLAGSWDDAPQGGMLQPRRLVKLDMTAQELITKYGLRCRIYIDLATKEKERDNDDPDLSCITVMAKDALQRIHILYQWADFVSMDKTARQLIAVRKLFKAEKVKGEKIGLQYAFRSILRQTCQLTGQPYFHVDDLSTAGGKEHRATALEGLLNLGVLCVPAAAPWLDAMMDDWALFPNGRYKDRVDAPAYGASDLQSIPEGQTPYHHPMLEPGQIDNDVMIQVHKRIAKARREARGEEESDDD